jgi:hypothetical protein
VSAGVAVSSFSVGSPVRIAWPRFFGHSSGVGWRRPPRTRLPPGTAGVYLTRFPKSAALREMSPNEHGRFDEAQLLATIDREVIVRIVLADANPWSAVADHTDPLGR